ncbi:MAG: response regulator [Planctomycetales bacterium]|nr:response regulator [Planctomycetales bacterium]
MTSIANRLDRPLEILLAEDSPTDAELTREALATCDAPHRVHLVADGVAALDFLLRKPPYGEAPRPDLIFLDLKMPRKDGHDVLAELKAHDDLKTIPVIVLTTSVAEPDVRQAYRHHANTYVTKPLDFGQFVETMQRIAEYWFQIATLPSS